MLPSPGGGAVRLPPLHHRSEGQGRAGDDARVRRQHLDPAGRRALQRHQDYRDSGQGGLWLSEGSLGMAREGGKHCSVKGQESRPMLFVRMLTFVTVCKCRIE